ncbi:MAG: hypothetical protein D6767_06725 [Candidatus Hydrogenedentota bacterium]|nr:MAG: hypothetical protein D6767_06725 [Candidatus Hydrogenedentota bacterium]
MKQKQCTYSIFETYFKNPQKAIEHAQKCTHCTDKIVRYEGLMATLRKAKWHKPIETDSAIQKKLTEVAEWIVSGKEIDPKYEKALDLIEKAGGYQELLEMVHYLMSSSEDQKKYTTPEFLRKIVANTLDHEASRESTSSIILTFKKGLRLINATAQELFVLPDSEREAVPVRAEATTSGVLQFYAEDAPEKNRILYQVVQDSPTTLMLTVRLHNFEKTPHIILLRKDGRLIQSQPLKDDFTYFSGLSAGQYMVEVKGKEGTLKKVNLQLLEE